MKQQQFMRYELADLRKTLRDVIPNCAPIPNLNKNSTASEIFDAINFLEIQGKYNQKIGVRS